MSAISCNLTVLQQETVAPDIRRLTVQWQDPRHEPHAGQFYMLRAWAADATPILSRPISVNDFDNQTGALTFLYQLKGEGTHKIAALQPGQTLTVTGPCGNGFDAAALAGKYQRIAVVGGGIGTAPLLQLAAELAAQGVRMIAPVWNAENALAGSCMTGGGLTAQGREFVRRAQRAGIIVDVSHSSERTFWDICEIAEKPIVASHSNAKAVCGHVRNLTDEQFRAICDLGGTAGLNLYGPFLTDGPRVTFDDLRRHLDHFLDLGGEGHIALGADLDGCDRLPAGFSGLDDYEALGDFLKNTGYSDETIQNLFCNSLMKVVKTCIM